MLSDRRELILHYYKKLNAIYKSDICIFETTYHSIGIGFLIQKAINEEKPTIVFHYEGKLSFFISGIVDKNLSIYEYNENNYRDVVKKAMEESRNKIGFNKLD